jgi:predicted phage terminase large subunit-like protein
VFRERLTFDALPSTIETQARQWHADGRLRKVIIEDKSSGKSAQYTLRATAEPWLREMLFAFQPMGSKTVRAAAASVYCRSGMVLLPHPGQGAEWLMDFEDELFSFPQSAFADQVDAFSQLVIYLGNYLAAGQRARGGNQ